MNILLTKTFTFLLLIPILTSSCCSYAVYNKSKSEIALQKALISNDEVAIRAVRMGSDGAGLGIDISNIEALTKHPILQILAAIGDAILMWGTYEGVKSIDPNEDKDHSGVVINIYGEGNNITVVTEEKQTSE